MPEGHEKKALKGVRKAAALLIVLGEEVSAQLLKQLDDDEIQLLSREMARVKGIKEEDVETILEEFYEMSVARSYVTKGGLDYARKVLMNAFGPEHAKRMLDRLVKALGHDAISFDALQKADPQQLAKFIHSEHPQTVALILSHLDPLQAAGLLMSLPPEMRADIALRMATLDQISPEIISKIATIIGQKLKALGEFSRESYGGVRAVAEMFNRLDTNTSKDILETIERSDANLVETIRHLMFIFDDILALDQQAIKEIVAKVDRKIITVALKGTGDQMKAHFLGAMSQRGADMMREDMDAMGPIKIKDVEAAQQQIISMVRKLETEGTISLKGAGSEQYVV